MTTLHEDIKALRDALAELAASPKPAVGDSISTTNNKRTRLRVARLHVADACDPARIARLLAAVEKTRDALKLTLHAVCLAGWEGDLSAEMARAALAQFEEKTK